jgi:DNA polymerase I-like protein with 3'-5' exonuclease and polymerase domains
MPNGKIAVIKDKALHCSSKSYELLESIMYNVVKIDRANVQVSDLDPFLSVKDVDVIMTVGEKALNYITDLKGITKYAGTVQTSAQGIPVVPIVSPGFLDHNPNYLRRFAEDILTAYHVSIGVRKEEVSNQYVVIADMTTLTEVITYIKQTGYCSFDFETTELTDMGTFDPDFYCTTLSLTFQQGSAYVIPLWHPDSPFDNIQLESIFYELEKHVFGNPDIVKIGQNTKFDMHCLVWCGVVNFRGVYHDTMLMHQLYNENISHKLKDMVRDFFPQFANYEAVLAKNWKASLSDLARYNALDSDLTFRLYWVLTDLLLEDERIYLMYRNLTAPAMVALFKMEETGMLVDKEFLTESIRDVQELIADQEALMRMHTPVQRFEEFKKKEERLAAIVDLQSKLEKESIAEYKSKQAQKNKEERIGNYKLQLDSLKSGNLVLDHTRINFNSPDQLKELLFTEQGFGFKMPQETYNSKPDSTGADNLDLIKDPSGFIEQLQVMRQLKKIEGTYLSSILNKLDENHYIHTNFNQHVAKTGRLSSDKPNLQNIITRTKYKVVEDSVALVKKSFVVPEGYTLVQADYSQIELRIVAHYAKELTMIEAYKNNQDIHELTAANSRGYTVEEFKKIDPKLYKQYRYEAKAENFGFVYGISPEGFREYARTTYGINISLRDAEKKRDAYFKKYPELLNYHKEFKNKAKQFKYVRTFFGRKVHLPDIDSSIGGIRGHAERNAINSPIQGTAGEMTIFAVTLLMIRLPKSIKIVNTIHDSILFYVPDNILEQALILIRETMENLPLKLYFGRAIDSLPIKVDFEVSKNNWKDLHGI